MKRIIVLGALLLLLGKGTALANDYSELNQAFTNFFTSLDNIMRDLPSVDSAIGTVQIVNIWSTAIDTMCGSIERFMANHPEISGQHDPPPELVESLGKLKRLGTDYAALPVSIKRLADRFSSAPEVQEAMKKLSRSIDHMRSMNRIARPPTK